MKFGKEFKSSLQEPDLAQFQEFALDYGLLKKQIHKIVLDLKAKGLDADSLKEYTARAERQRKDVSEEAAENIKVARASPSEIAVKAQPQHDPDPDRGTSIIGDGPTPGLALSYEILDPDTNGESLKEISRKSPVEQRHILPRIRLYLDEHYTPLHAEALLPALNGKNESSSAADVIVDSSSRERPKEFNDSDYDGLQGLSTLPSTSSLSHQNIADATEPAISINDQGKGKGKLSALLSRFRTSKSAVRHETGTVNDQQVDRSSEKNSNMAVNERVDSRLLNELAQQCDGLDDGVYHFSDDDLLFGADDSAKASRGLDRSSPGTGLRDQAMPDQGFGSMTLGEPAIALPDVDTTDASEHSVNMLRQSRQQEVKEAATPVMRPPTNATPGSASGRGRTSTSKRSQSRASSVLRASGRETQSASPSIRAYERTPPGSLPVDSRKLAENGAQSSSDAQPAKREVIIELESDSVFFQLLTSKLAAIDDLHKRQQATFEQSLEKASTRLLKAINVTAADAKRTTRQRLYLWRSVLVLWLESEIFFGQREIDRRGRSPEEAARRLAWFEGEMQRRGYLKQLTKGKDGKVIWEDFLTLNKEVLGTLRFQKLNEKALQKALKKHDKQTALVASQDFTNAMSTDPFFSQNIARGLYESMSKNLSSLVPQIEDYECGICTALAYKPIRLDCGHRFCLRCLVVLQKRGEKRCPHCRQPTLGTANRRNLDESMINFMKLWFPKEVRLKQRENERQAAIEEMQEMGYTITEQKCNIQ